MVYYFRVVEVQTADGLRYRYDVAAPAFPKESPYGSDIWGIFPPLTQSMAKILEKPLSDRYLVTDNTYHLLAKYLLNSGIADGSQCLYFGLNGDGVNQCGLEVTADKVFDWQNQYDKEIYESANNQRIPPRLMKALIAEESQFIPVPDKGSEYGLAHMTMLGADAMLQWNVPYYLSLCYDVFRFEQEKCNGGYSGLSEEYREILQSVVIARINAKQEFPVLAAAIRASAAQVGQMIEDVFGRFPRDAVGYEDLWKLTVANYTTGSGCLSRTL